VPPGKQKLAEIPPGARPKRTMPLFQVQREGRAREHSKYQISQGRTIDYCDPSNGCPPARS
jgi:hypothetical protein